MSARFHHFASVLFFTCFVLFANTAWGQIATPPLDPTVKVIMPAASSWRYVKGENDADDDRTATISGRLFVGEGENEDGSNTWTRTKMSYLMLAKTENVNIEAFILPSDTEKIERTSNSDITNERSQSQFGFSLLLRKISYGAFHRTFEKKRNDNLPIKRTGTGASVTAQLGSVFFMALGIELVDEAESNFVANSWSNTSYALAVMTGKPDKTQLRVEYSSTSSDEVEEAAANGRARNIHRDTSVTRLSAEIRMGDLLLSLNQEKQTELADNVFYSVDTETNTTKYGIARVPQNGWIFGAYVITKKETTGSSEDITNATRFHIGYNF